MTPRFQKFARLLVNNKDLKPSNTLNQTPPHDLGFYQLIQYVLSPPMAKLKNQPLDHHLRPMNELCHPCLINYTNLGRHETIEEDSNFVLATIGVHDVRIQLKEYYRSIPLEIILRIKDFYERDLTLFGYPAFS
jgi:hypothetical protein